MTWASYTSNLSSVFTGFISWLTSIANALITDKIFITIIFIGLLWVLFSFVVNIVETIKENTLKKDKNRKDQKYY